MGRYAHDGAGTIVSQYIIGQPDGNLFAVQRVNRIGTGEDAGLLLILHTVYVGLHGRIEDVFLYSLSGLVGSQALGQNVLRSQYHEGSAVKGVRSGGVNGDLLLAAFYREINLGAVGFSDPVGLHLFNLFRPVQLVQIIQKTLCIFGDAEHPLTKVFLGNRGAAALAAAVYYFLVGQSGLTGGAPVDRELFLIGQAFFEHLNENPLGPFIKIRICGVHFHIPVIDGCDLVDLAFDICDILCGGDGRMLAGLDGIVLCRKSECVPAHGMNQIITLEHFIAAPHIRNYISSPMSYMQSVS